MTEAEKKEYEAHQYQTYIKAITPTHNIWLQMLKAFIVGGLICTFGQFLLYFFQNTMKMEKDTAGLYCTLTLVFIGVLLTGLNIYQKLSTFAGAGALVPITGFANAVAAPAIEFKSEGHIFGIGSKIFSIAGPVILFGIFTSWGLGIVYWIMGKVTV
ncbi:MAG: SpoVA/SpoVAEb family sporulation membrane protein [Lachnospiraceae bacterium]|nr:SpoVA/SpoVAEb family sporulation membrane protein [Lachnospiraceae bacterium]